MPAFDKTFEVNVRGYFVATQHAARMMVEQGKGSIINVASIAGLSPGAMQAAYSMTKAAVISMTKAFAKELGSSNVRVNAICPGGILTPLLHRGNPEVVKRRLESLQPWPEAGTGEHIAGAALFLASDDAMFVTGEALVVDGGLTAMGPALPRRMRPEPDDALAQFQFVGVDKGTTGEPPVISLQELHANGVHA